MASPITSQSPARIDTHDACGSDLGKYTQDEVVRWTKIAKKAGVGKQRVQTMGDFAGGVPTLHTRVESWECDFNGHWNTRHYAQRGGRRHCHGIACWTCDDRQAATPDTAHALS
jgi:hypothetical protein